MNIVIENCYGKTYRVEGLSDDLRWPDLVDEFENLGLAMGYSPAIKSNEDGHYEWVANNEWVAHKEDNEKTDTLATD